MTVITLPEVENDDVGKSIASAMDKYDKRPDAYKNSASESLKKKTISVKNSYSSSSTSSLDKKRK